MERPHKHTTFLAIAGELAKRSTCARRQVGCVLVNRYGHIIGTGYNGVGSGLAHCTDNPCPGTQFQSGEGLDKCEAIHAEQNALLQCTDVMEIHHAYITCSPCIHCAKLFLNTGVREIFFASIYDQHPIKLLKSCDIECTLWDPA